jgi:hypothetical protein
MEFRLEFFRGFDFDGQLVDGVDCQALLECRVRPPLVGGDLAEIELRVPNSGAYVGHLSNPCSITGILYGGRVQINLHNVYYRRYSMNGTSARKTGSTPVELSHVGSLVISTLFNEQRSFPVVRNIQEIRFHINKNDYFTLPPEIEIASQLPFKQAEPFCTVKAPQLGIVKITREWVFTQMPDEKSGIAKCGLCAEVEFDTDEDHALANYLLHFENFLFAISFLTRQRVTLLGWDITYNDRVERTWKDPLDPLSTENVSSGRERFLLRDHNIDALAATVVQNFSLCSADLQEVCRSLLIGLVPFVKLRTPERFLSMFRALEACRKFSEPSNGESSQNSAELVQILMQAKSGASVSASERIDGFIRLIEGKTPSLKVQLQSFLVKWDVKCDDLWPLSGTAKLPGLIQVRDKIVHSGPLSLRFQGLADATKHLSVLLERITLQILNISLAVTNVHPDELDRDHWYDEQYVLRQRENIFNPDQVAEVFDG